MHMRVDKTRQDQLAAVIDNLGLRREIGAQGRCVTDALYLAIRDQQGAIFEQLPAAWHRLCAGIAEKMKNGAKKEALHDVRVLIPSSWSVQMVRDDKG